ncbi:uncharacterized protein LOC118645332 [Monomorium pharaonis]|uniref:uncharacterized protein LOC118645332 n=1 Tax=Monomorium pharaonis TaxID=307658 RepID=UPI0017463295|nr:uncharacterized protein LOC118645332 [Monomorium pharaonis]
MVEPSLSTDVSEIDSIITRVLKNLKTVDAINLKLADNTLPQIKANVDKNSNVRHEQSSSTFPFGTNRIKTEILDITKNETETNCTNTLLIKTNQQHVFTMADELDIEEENAVEYNKKNIPSASGSIEYESEPKSVVQSDKFQLAEGVFINKCALKNCDYSGVKN